MPEQERRRRVELVTHSGVGAEPGQFVCLRTTDVPDEQGVAEPVDGIHGGGETSQPCRVAGGAIDLRPHPVLHRAMAVDCVQRTTLALLHEGSHLGLDAPPFQLERPEPIGQFVIGDVDQMLNERREHEADAIELLCARTTPFVETV